MNRHTIDIHQARDVERWVVGVWSVESRERGLSRTVPFSAAFPNSFGVMYPLYYPFPHIKERLTQLTEYKEQGRAPWKRSPGKRLDHERC